MASSSPLLWARQNGDGSEQDDMTKDQGASASSVVTTLVPVLIYAVIFFLLFCVFRKWFPRNYRPRAVLGTLRPSERTPDLPTGLFNWIKPFYEIPDTYVLQHHSMDGYLFLRFLKISVITCLVGCVITFPVLFPVNITGGGTKKQFEILTMANVTDNYYKMFAHAGCAIIFFGFVIYMITRETIFFINLRQAYLMSPFYTSRLSSKVVMYTSVPDNYMSETKLREMLGPAVRRVWLATDCKELEDLVKERDGAHSKLEAAETKLIKTANANKLKADKKAAKQGERSNSEEIAMADLDPESGSGSISARYLQPKQRPVHRLKPLIGKKVDTIDFTRGELQRLIPQVAQMQAAHKKREGKLLGTAFVEFASVHDAQAAYQSLTHHHILHMQPRFTGMTPTEILWGNLNIKWWERVIREIVVIAFVVALIVFWAVPVAFVGAISKVDRLIELVPALSFINNLPKVLLGLITGLLPVILLAVLMALLPIVLRLAAKISGCPTRSAVELAVQNYYFAFQVIQVFLVTTLGASATAVVDSVKENPAGAPNLLANNIPTASTFYLSYFLLQGFGIVANALLAVVGLIVFKVLGKLLDNTPRKMYNRWVSLAGLGWGTLFPIYTNLFVIAICYAAIAPLVLLFAAIGLYFFYFAFRYNMLYVYNADIDTKGAIYPRALQQVFVGLYIAEVCLIGLFALASGGSSMAPANGKSGPDVQVYSRGALGPLILMIIMLIFTALYHISLNSAMAPHLEALPKSIGAEEERLLAAEHGEGNGYHNGAAANKEPAHESVAEGGNPALNTPAPHKAPNFFTKWLRPDIYCDYETLRRIAPQADPVEYSPEVESNAYYNPAITSELGIIWIPRDPLGISKEEVRDTGKVLPITDEGAHLDEKNSIHWGSGDGEDLPPIYQEKIHY